MLGFKGFANLLGINRSSVYKMRDAGKLVIVNGKINSSMSIEKLKTSGSEFHDNNHLVTKDNPINNIKEQNQNINIFSKEVEPENNLSNMSDEDKAEREKLLLEADALRKEAEENEEHGAVDHTVEIGKLDLTEARLIKEYWIGVSLRQKTEVASKELVYQKDVEAAQFDLARQIREKLESRPKIAFKMVGKNIQEIEDILEKEKEDILEIMVSIDVS